MRRSSLVYVLLLAALSVLLVWQWCALRSLRTQPLEVRYDTVHVERAVPRYVRYLSDTVVRAHRASRPAVLPQPAAGAPAEPQDSAGCDIMSCDSVDVVLPIDEHIYTDDSTYRVRVVGSLIRSADIDIIHHTQRVTAPAKPRVKVRPCIYVGYGLTFSGGIRAGPQIGGGISITY